MNFIFDIELAEDPASAEGRNQYLDTFVSTHSGYPFWAKCNKNFPFEQKYTFHTQDREGSILYALCMKIIAFKFYVCNEKMQNKSIISKVFSLKQKTKNGSAYIKIQ